MAFWENVGTRSVRSDRLVAGRQTKRKNYNFKSLLERCECFQAILLCGTRLSSWKMISLSLLFSAVKTKADPPPKELPTFGFLKHPNTKPVNYCALWNGWKLFFFVSVTVWESGFVSKYTSWRCDDRLLLFSSTVFLFLTFCTSVPLSWKHNNNAVCCYTTATAKTCNHYLIQKFNQSSLHMKNSATCC